MRGAVQDEARELVLPPAPIEAVRELVEVSSPSGVPIASMVVACATCTSVPWDGSRPQTIPREALFEKHYERPRET